MRIQHTRPFSRRRFLGAMTLAGPQGCLPAAKRVAAEPPPRRPRLGGCGAPPSAWPPIMSLKNCCTGRIHRGAPRADERPVVDTGRALRRGRYRPEFRRTALGPARRGRPTRHTGGRPRGLLRAVRDRAVRAIRDLKGKTVSVPELGSPQHVFLTSIAAHVGLDPGKEIDWVIHPRAKAMQLLTEGKIDAFLGFPPEPQELRAKGSGTWWSTARWTAPGRNTSAAWSTHAGVRPEIPGGDQAGTARHSESGRRLCSRTGANRRVSGRQGLRAELQLRPANHAGASYGKWREYDHEDTVRFYALRLHEAGMIKSTPQKLLAQSTDWRFLNALKKEMKG